MLPPKIKKQVGFTLLELLLTMSILSTLVLFSIPYLQSFLQNYRFKMQVLAVQQTLIVAKLSAIQASEPMIFCLIDRSHHCVLGPSYDYQVYRPKQKSIMSSGHLGEKMQWHGFPKASLGVIFNTEGFAESNGHFSVLSHDTHKKYRIVINKVGRVRVSAPIE